MTKEIEGKITYTPEDFVRNVKYIQSRQILYKYSLLIPIILLICMLLFVYTLDPAKFRANFLQPDKILVFGIPISLMGIWWILRKYSPSFLLKRQIENQFKSSPALRETQYISFDEKGLYGTSQFGSGQTNWEAIIEATETEDDFFFFTTKKFAQFIPKRFFTEEQINQIRELAKRKLDNKAMF
jgi:hypothetical protein